MSEIICHDISIEFKNQIYNNSFFKLKNHKIVQNSTALKKINIRIQKYERVGLLGKNGAGKTTFLRMLSGVYPPSKGILKINSPVISFLDIGVGMDENATGYQNIPLLMAAREIPFEFYKNVVTDVENFSELGDALFHPVRTYSLGMKLRIAFTVATHIFYNQIILMDEIIAFGDNQFKKKSKDRIFNQINNCKVLVIASHSPSILQTYCDRGIVLDNGEVIFDGKIKDAINFNK